MEYKARLSTFEGPLDLLLHLIRKNEINIYDIPISKITEQYMEHLEIIRQLDFDNIGEFLVMAATLAYIKSQTLLPVEDVSEDGDGVDPRQELAMKLLEYQLYRDAAEELMKRPKLGVEVFTNVIPEAEQDEYDEKEQEIEEIGLYDLVHAYHQVMSEEKKTVHEVEEEKVSLKKVIRGIIDFFRNIKTTEFSTILPAHYTRIDVIINFLAILELARYKFLNIFQNENFGAIRLQKASGEDYVDMDNLSWED